jgi:hypothetical protein
VSKIVIWGHWIVGLLAAALAAQSIWGIVGNTISMDRGARLGPQVLRADSMFAVLAVIWALRGWGILKWRLWGHVLALGIFAFVVFVGGLGAFVEDSGLLYPVAGCVVLSWLLLPSVRSAYWEKVQTT